jgi:hypothetical protein
MFAQRPSYFEHTKHYSSEKTLFFVSNAPEASAVFKDSRS